MKPAAFVLPAVALVCAAHAVAAPITSARTLADTAWARCGAPIALGSVDRSGLVTITDGQGGLYAVWQAIEPSSQHADLVAQHLDADGAPVSGWPADGLGLTTAPGDQLGPIVVPDGAGGLLIAWSDDRADTVGGTNPDIYALRVGVDGSRAAGWNTDGNA